ncbi:hypothetical protein L6164_022682 [Bauhinia variegata]|uniref:Uncharacterized protein n=1 Tax=Bauhinia variegata TaxID=167791 RepID=A0ACB9MJA4_BAUVA|nr:hypothetical protein L6164_022682 [Bauhinia variegata]
MGTARLLGASTPRFLVQVLSIKHHRAENLTIIRHRHGGPQKSKVDGGGGGGQTNRVGTMSVEEKPTASISNQIRDNINSSRKGNDQQVNGNIAKN